jgi:DNA-binding NarL/FixJ family response regulator
MDQVAVHVVAQDAVATVGLALLLRCHPRIVESADPDVIVFSTPRVDRAAMDRIRRLPDIPVVLLTGVVDEASLPPLIECGVVGIVDRTRAGDPELIEAVLAAYERKSLLPKDLLAELGTAIRAMRRETVNPLALNPAGLNARELEVLRLLADGAEIAEIARKLTYSESTIKHVLHTLSTRFNFRNRVHAVAFALRAGVL